MRLCACALALALLGGCRAVYVSQPIGDAPEDIQADAADWEGSWLGPEGMTLTVHVADGTNGFLNVGYVESSKEGLKVESFNVYLRSCAKEWTFASMLPASETNETRYLWGRIKKDDRMIILWPPDVSKFDDLVTRGCLPGTVSNATHSTSVYLGSLGTNHLDLIRSETNGVLFVWDQPLVFLKLSK